MASFVLRQGQGFRLFNLLAHLLNRYLVQIAALLPQQPRGLRGVPCVRYKGKLRRTHKTCFHFKIHYTQYTISVWDTYLYSRLFPVNQNRQLNQHNQHPLEETFAVRRCTWRRSRFQVQIKV